MRPDAQNGLRTAALAVLSALAISSGCADPGAGIRRHTYPPDFDYITKEQLQSSMWVLAAQVRELDKLLDREEAVDQVAVVTALTEIERNAGLLDRGGHARNHPLLGTHLQQFRHEVERARVAASAVPPRYFLAGTVSGGCSHCHGFGD